MFVFGEQSGVDKISELIDGFVGFHGPVRGQEFFIYIKKREEKSFLLFRFAVFGKFRFYLF